MEEKVKMRWGDPKTRDGKRLTPGRRGQVYGGWVYNLRGQLSTFHFLSGRKRDGDLHRMVSG